MKKIIILITLILFVSVITSCEETTTTTTTTWTSKNIKYSSWEAILGNNTMKFNFASETEFTFVDTYNGTKPVSNICTGTYTTENNTTINLTFKTATGTKPSDQTCTVKDDSFVFGGITFNRK